MSIEDSVVCCLNSHCGSTSRGLDGGWKTSANSRPPAWGGSITPSHSLEINRRETGLRILAGESREWYGSGSFPSCLRAGRFPSDWKMATLVLLRKERNPRTLHRSIRFACDLDELSKLFKRISCPGFTLSWIGLNLCDDQYGFQRGDPRDPPSLLPLGPIRRGRSCNGSFARYSERLQIHP